MDLDLRAQIAQTLSPDVARQLASTVGMDDRQGRVFVDAAVPALLAAFLHSLETGGAQALSDAVANSDPNALERLRRALEARDLGPLNEGANALAPVLGAAERDRNAPRTAERNENHGPARVRGNVKMSPEHATRVSEVLRREGHRENVNISVRVGVRVPETVSLRPLPEDIIAFVPEYRGYDYFIDENDEIVFVAPQTHEVVGMIDYEGRAAAVDSPRAARPCPTED